MRNRVYIWRRTLGWTQRQAAEFLEVPLRTYEGWESGRKDMQNSGPVRKLMRLASTKFGVKEVNEDTTKE